MKKIITILISIITVILCFSSCDKELDVHSESIEIMKLMEMKANSEDYWQLCISGTTESFEKHRAYFIANDYDTPIRAYKITQPTSDMVKQKLLLREGEEEELNNLPEVLREELITRYTNLNIIFEVVLNYIQSSDSGTFFSSTCNTSTVIENATIEKAVAYLYIFETGKPIVVLFSNNQQGGVRVQGMFLTNSTYETLSLTRDIFEPYGCTVEIEFDGVLQK